MIRSIMSITAVAVAASVLAAAVPATAMANTVKPATGSGCYYGVTSADPQGECTTVTGTGLEVVSIAGWAVNRSLQAVNGVHIEFYGPNGLITNSPTFNLPGDTQTGKYTWHNPHPTVNVTAGDYCTELWQAASGGGYIALADECIEVHT